ncbi:MAG: hypothetical protein JWP89_6383 [Schlesneria sp.]|nr:hypothetical protein [Schlesneria sp.]
MSLVELVLMPLVVSWCISVALAISRCHRPFFGLVMASAASIACSAIWGLIDEIRRDHHMPGMTFIFMTLCGILSSPVPGLVAVLVLLNKNRPTDSPDEPN